MSIPDTSDEGNIEGGDVEQINPAPKIDLPKTMPFYMNQCIEGGWVEDTVDGRTLDVDSNFSYVVDFEFKNEAARQTFWDRPDYDEINNTMIKTLREMSQTTFDLELDRDFTPDAYKDGILPDDTTRQFSDSTLDELNNDVLPNFVDIMNGTYPDLGLVGAKVDPESVSQTAGCYDGIPNNLADGLQEPVVNENGAQPIPLKM